MRERPESSGAYRHSSHPPVDQSACDHRRDPGLQRTEIAKVDQWTLEQHLNYAIDGLKQADFPGGIVPNHALNGTPELAYGITDWWAMGFYAPFAVDYSGTFYSNAAKLRELFVTPNAAQKEFFYGANFELSYAMPQFSQTRWDLEIRPIIGFRREGYEFIVNPIVDTGFGKYGETSFAPCARFARKLGEDLSIGI
ncbi:MAG TPA: hypothetical protein VLW88_00445, partial [Hyphomicrobium sp.]|nr:hypothetical protein [Hyphomicrobium sp.]